MAKYLEKILRVSRISLNARKLSMRHVKHSFLDSGMLGHTTASVIPCPPLELLSASFVESASELTMRTSQLSFRMSTCVQAGSSLTRSC